MLVALRGMFTGLVVYLFIICVSPEIGRVLFGAGCATVLGAFLFLLLDDISNK